MSEHDGEFSQSTYFKDDSSLEMRRDINNPSVELLKVDDFRRQLESAIENTPGKIVITGHSGEVLPDGDDVFSMLAMKRILEKKYPGKDISIVMSERPVHVWDNFAKPGEITWANTQTIEDGGVSRAADVVDYIQKGDILLCLDQGSMSHFTRYPEKINEDSGVRAVILDHHKPVSDTSAGLRLRSAGAVSTTELIGRMYGADDLDKETYALLYMGMSADTGDFSFRDYGETKTFGKLLLEKSGFDFDTLMKRLKTEPQFADYLKKFGGHHTVVETEGKPRIAYEYLSAEDMNPAEKADNINYCLQSATRSAINKMPKNDSDIRFIVTPANAAQDGTMIPDNDVYKLEFRRSMGVTTDLSVVAAAFGGGGHDGASGATWRLSEEQRDYIRKHQSDNGFNQMEYVAGLVVEKLLENS